MRVHGHLQALAAVGRRSNTLPTEDENESARESVNENAEADAEVAAGTGTGTRTGANTPAPFASRTDFPTLPELFTVLARAEEHQCHLLEADEEALRTRLHSPPCEVSLL